MPPTVLYHYTNTLGYGEIIGKPVTRAGELYAKLLSSTSAISGDAHYGDGWYFTDLPPHTGSRIGIARALWDGSYERNLAKTEYFIAFRIHGNTKIVEPRPHVFFVPQSSDFQPEVLDHGKTLAPERPISPDASDTGRGQGSSHANPRCRFCREEHSNWASLRRHIRTSHLQEYGQVEAQLDFEFGKQVEKDSPSTDDMKDTQEPAPTRSPLTQPRPHSYDHPPTRSPGQSIVRRILDWFGV